MPMPFENAVMTDGGAALLTKAQAGECKIEFTKMAIGDGSYSEEEKTIASLQARTDLKDHKNDYKISGCSVYTEKSVKVTALISNMDPLTYEAIITEGYYINEVGLYAKEADGSEDTEILYSIAVTSGEQGDYMPPYNGYNPAEITQDFYVTVDNSANVSIDSAGAAFTVDQAAEMKAELEAEINDTGTAGYEGQDVTEKFAEEIAEYSDVWHWIKARVNAGNFEGLKDGDFIPLTVGDETHEMQMNIDTYYRTTDETLGHHIDFISRDCMGDTVQWNLENNNNGNADSSYPYMVSNLYDWLNNTVYPKLPDSLKEVITNKRAFLEQRYSSSGTLTDSINWGWQDPGPLWPLFETEVAGYIKGGTAFWSGGQDVQYPIFANSWKNRVKGAGPGGSRCAWWLICVRSGSSTNACIVAYNGLLSSNYASTEYRVPLCFRIAAD